MLQSLLKRDINTLHACKGTFQFPKELGYLTGVAVAPSGNIFVSDYSNDKIHVFGAERKFAKSFRQLGADKLWNTIKGCYIHCRRPSVH